MGESPNLEKVSLCVLFWRPGGVERSENSPGGRWTITQNPDQVDFPVRTQPIQGGVWWTVQAMHLSSAPS